MSVLLLGGCFLLLWHHALLQRLPWRFPANDKRPQRGAAPLSCRCLAALFTTQGRQSRHQNNWIVSAFLLQGPRENSSREQSAHYMWFTHQQGRNLLWGVGFVGMPTPSKDVFGNQFVYCDFCLWLKLSREAQLLHGRVSRTLDQVSALRQESSGLTLSWHQCPGSAKDVLLLMWIQSNKENEQ